MRFIKDKRIMVMSLVDLEHCGFDYNEYIGELFLHGIDEKEAEIPVMMVVDFAGGAIVTDNISTESLYIMKKDHNMFMKYIEDLGIEI